MFLISMHLIRKKLPGSPFMNKKLSKAIMTRIKLRKNFLKKLSRGKSKTLPGSEIIVYLFLQKLKENFTEMLMKVISLTIKLFGRVWNLFFHIKQELRVK